MGADKLITLKFAADMNSKTKNILDIAFKSIDILFEGRAQYAIEISDVVIDFDLPDVKLFSTNKVDYCYDIGYATTMARMDEIKEMLKEE